MATFKIRGAQSENNPFRDLTAFPYIATKEASLIDSVLTSGSFWENLLARMKDNAPIPEMQDGAYLFDTETGAFTHYLQLAYGHHRAHILETLMEQDKLGDIKGVEVMEFSDGTQDYVYTIVVQELDDPTMLKIMGNENKDDGVSPIIPLLETCRQTGAIIVADIEGIESFDAYEGAFITEKKEWGTVVANIKKNGVPGARTIAKFLGETWPINDISTAMKALSRIDEGKFDQSDLVDFPSTGLLKNFCTFADNIHAREALPNYFKALQVERMIQCITDPDFNKGEKPTVRTLGLAAKAMKDEKDHDRDACLIARKGASSRNFTPAIHIKQMLQEDNDLTDDQLMAAINTHDDELELLGTIVEEGRKAFEQAVKKLEDSGDDEGAGDGDADSDLESEIQDAATETLEGGADLPPVEGEDAEKILRSFVDNAGVMASYAANLAALAASDESINGNPELIEAASQLTGALGELNKVLYAE